MPYLGAKPTPIPLTSSDITDGIITTAKIVDDAVTGAKIENNPTIAGNLAVSGTANVTGVTTLSDNIVFDASSKGVHLGVTSATASNLLDDYEASTWTPTYVVDVGTNPTITYDTTRTQGVYVKIGDMVHIQCRIRTDATSGGSGNLAIGGLPFASVSGDSRFSTLNVGYSAQWVADNFPVGIYIPPNVSYALLLKGRGDDHRDGKGLVISPASLTNNTGKNEVMVSGTYRTA
jgi:hypothetical protein